MTKRIITEGSQFLGETLENYKVDDIPAGTPKLTFYNTARGRQCKFTVRHYYIDINNRIVYRYYPGLKICTSHPLTSQHLRVVDDDDKNVALTFGQKLKSHMNNEKEFWDKNNADKLFKAWDKNLENDAQR